MMTLMGMRPVASPRADVGELLRRVRLRRFVGRTAELGSFRAALLAPENRRTLFYLHGPGGIGKSALLDAMAGIAAEVGVRPVRIDLATLACVAPRLVREAVDVGLATLADPGVARPVVLLDGGELLSRHDDGLRRHVLAALPEGALVVIASTVAPDPVSRIVVRELPLRNLSAVEAGAYLNAEGVDPQWHAPLFAVSHGHPLALSLLVERFQRRGPGSEGDPAAPLTLAEVPDVLRSLLDRVVGVAPSPAHRMALQVVAHTRRTTEQLLRVIIGDADAGAVFAWLRSQPFVADGPDGLAPCGLARDVIDADLRWRDRPGYAALHRRIRGHLVDLARSAADEAERRRRIADVLFLARGHAALGDTIGSDGDLPRGRVDTVRATDRGAVRAMVERHQCREQADLVEYWLDRQPGAFRAFRDADGVLIGFAGLLALHEVTAADLAVDPGAAAMWRYAVERGRARGERVTALRFFLDAELGHRPSASLTLCALWRIGAAVGESSAGTGPAWDLVGIFEGAAAREPLMSYLGYTRAVEADHTVGPLRFAVFSRRWRESGGAEWLAATAARELGDAVGPALPHQREEPLTEAEFAGAVRQGLRDFHDSRRLAANALRRSRLVQAGGPQPDPVAAMRAVLQGAVDGLRTQQPCAELCTILDMTFLRPTASQERVAETLHLSFSTYRRQRDRAVQRVIACLWAAEVDTWRAPAGVRPS